MGSSVDACMVKWKEEGSIEPAQGIMLARNMSNLTASNVTDGQFSNNTNYTVKAVGLRRNNILDTISVTRTFHVSLAEGIICQNEMGLC